MLKHKTHFEQVPLEVVEKILKEAGAEIAIEPARASADQKLEAQEPAARTLGGRRKSPTLFRGKLVRHQAP